MNLVRTNRFVVEPANLLCYIGFAVSLTLFLFYIDEGYYSFNWMSEPGAWIIFSVYSLIFLILQLLIDAFTFRKVTGIPKAAVSMSIVFISLFFMMLLTLSALTIE